MSEAQTLTEAGKPVMSKNAPGASDQTPKAGEGAPLYRVVARRFYSDRMYVQGETLRYEGEPSEGVLELDEGAQSKASAKKSAKGAAKAKAEVKAEDNQEVL